MKIYTLNAFTKNGTGGNPAGVIFNGDIISDTDKQYIAKKIGFSETAFVEKSDKADFKVRFFSPNGEVDLCGHATIASFCLMSNLEIIKVGKYTQETKAGILKIELTEDGSVLMDQNLPEFFEPLNIQEIATSLNIPTNMILSELPVQIVSTGLRDILIPIVHLEDLKNINPDFDKISQVSKKYNVIGYHLFTLETLFNATAHCRNFAPLYDIPEEAATGTSNGALSCYLFKYKKIAPEYANNLVFEQGYSMGQPSEILAQLEMERGNIQRVRVGGTASNIKIIQI